MTIPIPTPPPVGWLDLYTAFQIALVYPHLAGDGMTEEEFATLPEYAQVSISMIKLAELRGLSPADHLGIG
jgi:hypothetical protein